MRASPPSQLGIGVCAESGPLRYEVPVLQAVYGRMQGIVRMHSPSMVVSPLADIDAKDKEALRMAAVNCTALVQPPSPRCSG